MIQENVAQLLNDQITKEFYSAYLYMDFVNYYTGKGLEWFWRFGIRSRHRKKRDHALLFIKYMQNNSLKITLEAIGKPDAVYVDNTSALKAGLAHEQLVTASINTIYETAYNAKDFRTMQFLDWFIKEQGEEEMNAENLITKMQLFGSDSKSLYMLNSELGTRIYAPAIACDISEPLIRLKTAEKMIRSDKLAGSFFKSKLNKHLLIRETYAVNA